MPKRLTSSRDDHFESQPKFAVSLQNQTSREDVTQTTMHRAIFQQKKYVAIHTDKRTASVLNEISQTSNTSEIDQVCVAQVRRLKVEKLPTAAQTRQEQIAHAAIKATKDLIKLLDLNEVIIDLEQWSLDTNANTTKRYNLF